MKQENILDMLLNLVVLILWLHLLVVNRLTLTLLLYHIFFVSLHLSFSVFNFSWNQSFSQNNILCYNSIQFILADPRNLTLAWNPKKKKSISPRAELTAMSYCLVSISSAQPSKVQPERVCVSAERPPTQTTKEYENNPHILNHLIQAFITINQKRSESSSCIINSSKGAN